MHYTILHGLIKQWMHCSKHENQTVNHCIHHQFWSKAVEQVFGNIPQNFIFHQFQKVLPCTSPNLDVSRAVGWFHKSHHLSMLDSSPIDVEIHKSKGMFGNIWARMDWNCRSTVQYCVKSLKEQPDLYVSWISKKACRRCQNQRNPQPRTPESTKICGELFPTHARPTSCHACQMKKLHLQQGWVETMSHVPLKYRLSSWTDLLRKSSFYPIGKSATPCGKPHDFLGLDYGGSTIWSPDLITLIENQSPKRLSIYL